MDPDIITCTICMETYSDQCQPRNLGCGHSLCTACLAGVLLNTRECPECRYSLSAASSALLYPVGYQLLRIARQYQEPSDQEKQESVTPKKKTLPDAGECELHGSKLFFRCMPCEKWVCRDCVVIEHVQKKVNKCNVLNIEEAIVEIKSVRSEEIGYTFQNIELAKKSLNNVVEFLTKREESCKQNLVELQAKIDEQKKILSETQSKSQDATSKLEELSTFRESLEEKKQALGCLQLPGDVISACTEITDCQKSITSAIEYNAKFIEDNSPEIESFIDDDDDDDDNAQTPRSCGSTSPKRTRSKRRLSSSSASSSTFKQAKQKTKKPKQKRRVSSSSGSSASSRSSTASSTDDKKKHRPKRGKRTQKKRNKRRVTTSEEEEELSYDSSADIEMLHRRTPVSVKKFFFS